MLRSSIEQEPAPVLGRKICISTAINEKTKAMGIPSGAENHG